MGLEVSVIMSVYNTQAEYLKEAIDSILNQSFQDFEFIIIDDNSNENVKNVLNKYSNNPKIVLLNNVENKGLTKNLNTCLSIAKGKYIARMDSDDISLPNRLYEQWKYMEQHSDVAAVGSYVKKKGANKKKIVKNFEQNQSILRVKMLFFNAGIVHPSAFIRSSFLKKHNITYNEQLTRSQDYGLWAEILDKNGIIKVVPQVLLLYRVHDQQVTHTQAERQNKCVEIVMRKLLSDLNCTNTELEMKIHREIYNFHHSFSVNDFANYLLKLEAFNLKYKKYDINAFKFVLYSMWKKDVVRGVLKYHDIQYLLCKTNLKILALPLYRLKAK